MTVGYNPYANAENWSLCYDRNVIAKYSDYIMLMAYDENVKWNSWFSSIFTMG